MSVFATIPNCNSAGYWDISCRSNPEHQHWLAQVLALPPTSCFLPRSHFFHAPGTLADWVRVAIVSWCIQTRLSVLQIPKHHLSLHKLERCKDCMSEPAVPFTCNTSPGLISQKLSFHYWQQVQAIHSIGTSNGKKESLAGQHKNLHEQLERRLSPKSCGG